MWHTYKKTYLSKGTKLNVIRYSRFKVFQTIFVAVATLGYEFITFVQQWIRVRIFQNYQLFHKAQVTCTWSASVGGWASCYGPFDSIRTSIETPYILWEFRFRFVDLVSERLCVVIVSGFEISFTYTIVMLLHFTRWDNSFINKAFLSTFPVKRAGLFFCSYMA